MKKLLIGLLLLVTSASFAQSTSTIKNVLNAKDTLIVNKVKITGIQKDKYLQDSTKVPTSLAVKTYVEGMTTYFLSVEQSRTTADYDKTSNTTLSNIPGLTASLDSGKSYYFEARIYTTMADAGGGVKFSIYSTVSKTALVYDGITSQGSDTRHSRGTSWGEVVAAYTDATEAFTVIKGTVTAVSSNGTITVQFAQNVSDAATSTVMTGAIFIVTEIL